MSEQRPDSLIPYDEIVQEALRAVVGRVLGEVEATGRLPGEHHFYITFKTAAAGVDIPRHLAERFPDDMTIVIQNRFWDLKVREEGFEVGLSFNQAPAKLFIPFSAITGFQDPAVDFALQFHARADDVLLDEHDRAENDSPAVEPVEDGSNVVSVDFKRKK
ncbi:MAG TPA: ClpXP protease specificity-enhancing factor SspB [Allosphingosinicella sp.]|nr:ClpXP protease specificity-enhancing factor SspB [Allosphingosinicella sp.]